MCAGWTEGDTLLCGEAEPKQTLRGEAILGGCEIGEDLGYGPARFLEPQDVREISTVLSAINPGDLRDNFDPQKMMDIYPAVWDRQDEDNLQWLLDAFTEVQGYYRLAAEKGFAMLIYLT